MTPEFSRLVRIDTLGEGGRMVEATADAAERAALATRFGLIAIDRLAADAEVRSEGEIVFAVGRLKAAVVQACVASGEPVPAEIDERFSLKFVPEADGAGEELELDAEELDTIDYAGGAIDLGEAVAETLALSLDPFPRSPDADAILKAAGVLSEDEVVSGPFAALQALKDTLK